MAPLEDDDADTVVTVSDDTMQTMLRAGTCNEWPPEPPLPITHADTRELTAEQPPPISEELDAVLAEGTAPPEGRRASFYTIPRRPTTSSGER